MNRNINISQEEFEAIEKYIRQEMSVEEKDTFIKRLASDIGFQHKLETVKLLMVGVQEVELAKKMEDFHRDLLSSTRNTMRPAGKTMSLKSWLVAASVIVIVGFGLFLYLTGDSKEEKIFAAYYAPDQGLISAMSTTDNYLFDRAMIDYKTGKYEAAINTWESMLTSETGNDTLNYYIASAYLAKGQNEIAITHFQKVIAAENSYFLNDALWYTGLALLKENKIKEAIPFIEKSEHQDKATLLLKLKEAE